MVGPKTDEQRHTWTSLQRFWPALGTALSSSAACAPIHDPHVSLVLHLLYTAKHHDLQEVLL